MKKLYNERRFHTFREIIDSSAALFSKSDAFIIKKGKNNYRKISYTELRDTFYGLCRRFIELGYKGKKIAVMGKNCYEWVVCYLAAASVGVVVPIDKELGEQDVKNFTDAAECCAVCADDACIDKIKSDAAIHPFSDVEKLAEEGKVSAVKESEIPDPEKDEMRVLLFTSGTTGSSKAVCLSQNNICVNIYSTLRIVHVDSTKDSTMSILPLHHTYECTLNCILMISKGLCISYAESLRTIANNIKEYSPSVLVVVPELLKVLDNRIKANIAKECPQKYRALYENNSLAYALSHTPFIIRTVIKSKVKKTLGGKIRLFIVGAADLDTAIVDDFTALGIRTLQGYGLTECSPLLAGNNDFYFNPKSTGVAIPGVELKIDEPNEEGVGEILAKGENIMLGYFNDDEATKAVFRDGWFCTGDYGRMDPDGALYITGRKKNIIVTENGKNIYPEELEARLSDCEAVGDVIIVPAEINGRTQIKARIYPNTAAIKDALGHIPSDEEKLEAIKKAVDAVNAAMPKYKNIRAVDILNSPLERTTTRKVKRFGENVESK